jgi:hypothetical protein
MALSGDAGTAHQIEPGALERLLRALAETAEIPTGKSL